VFDCVLSYDKSIISKERLLQYKNAEVSAGVTLVGPHRDDFCVLMNKSVDVEMFGSRGQQRLVVLQLKLLQLSFMEQSLGVRPLFLLDDIFSELDNEHIKLVMEMVGLQQTILTTTHGEFIEKNLKKDASVVEL
jgi:DNA replication and repair protein RecF